MASVNKAIIMGNLGKDPEVKYVDKGVCVAQLTVATTERGYELESGTRVPDRTEWHNIVLWRQAAEFAERYVHKGDLVYIEGRIKTRSYTDKQGHTRYVTEIWGDTFELVGSKSPANPPQQS